MYGAPNPVFAATISGFVNGDTTNVIGGQPDFTTPATTTSPVGGYPLVPSVGTLSAENYTFTNFVNGTNALTPAPLWVAANSGSKTYGQTVPPTGFGFTPVGLLNGDTVTNVTLTSTGFVATASVSGSPYAIVPSAALGTGLSNYAISYTNGALTVLRALPVVAWTNPAPIVYGTPLGTNKLNATANVAGVNVAGVFVYIPANGAVLPAGTNTLSAVFTPTDSTDYSNVTLSVRLVVLQASLTVSANDTNRIYGAPNPAFTDKIIGLTNGDNITVSNWCSATSSSPAGTYDIIPIVTGPPLVVANYDVVKNYGTLIVYPELTVAITSPTTNAYYVSTTNTLRLAGTVSDELSVLEMTWSNTGGGGGSLPGTAPGTNVWSIPEIPLRIGTNVVTVTAFDASGNPASATITILYTQPTEAIFTDVRISGRSLIATLTGLSNGSTVILESSNDLRDWIPVQTNTVSGTTLPITVPIGDVPGATVLRARVQ